MEDAEGFDGENIANSHVGRIQIIIFHFVTELLLGTMYYAADLLGGVKVAAPPTLHRRTDIQKSIILITASSAL